MEKPKRYRLRIPKGDDFHIAFAGAPSPIQLQKKLADNLKPFLKSVFNAEAAIIHGIREEVQGFVDPSVKTNSPVFVFYVEAGHLDAMRKLPSVPKISCSSLVDRWAQARVDGLDMDYYFSRVLDVDDWDLLFYVPGFSLNSKQQEVDSEIRRILATNRLPFQALSANFEEAIKVAETTINVRLGRSG